MEEQPSVGDTSRRLSAPLLLCMLIVPIAFVWLFLRPGYAPSLRWAAFTYTATFLSIGFLGGLGHR